MLSLCISFEKFAPSQGSIFVLNLFCKVAETLNTGCKEKNGPPILGFSDFIYSYSFMKMSDSIFISSSILTKLYTDVFSQHVHLNGGPSTLHSKTYNSFTIHFQTNSAFPMNIITCFFQTTLFNKQQINFPHEYH